MENDALTVVLGADSLLSRRSGVGRMTWEIANAISGRPEISTLRLLVQGRLQPFTQNGALSEPAESPPMTRLRRAKLLIAQLPGVGQAHMAKKLWLQRRGLRSFVKTPRLVYHEPNMIPYPLRAKTVITVNDLSWHHHPEMHPKERVTWIRQNLKRTFAQAARFVCISDFTANSLSAEFGIPRERIDVVSLAADAAFAPVSAADAAPTLARFGLADRRYVLSVSTVEPRKNFDRLLSAHQSLPADLRQRFPLVIVGGSGWGTALASPQAAAAQADGSLRLLGHVADADLVPLYARAAVFAYVSLYEGFGLPVIEAMGAGSPVVASSTTAVGETAGTAALLVDPLDPSAIRDALREVLEDTGLAESLRTSGAARAAEFNWQRTADALVASWRRALAA